jgi:hypothetical protein
MDVGGGGVEGIIGMSMSWAHGNGAEDSIPDPTPFPRGVQEFTMDDTGPAAGQYTKTCPVVLSRGTYRQSDYMFLYQEATGSHHLMMKSAVVAGGQIQPKAAVASDCLGPNTGIYDFSGMSALNPAAAKQWQINF